MFLKGFVNTFRCKSFRKLCIATFLVFNAFNTAKAFNQFYNKHQVLQADSEQLISARLELIKATAVVLKNGLNLLGVEVLENM